MIGSLIANGWSLGISKRIKKYNKGPEDNALHSVLSFVLTIDLILILYFFHYQQVC